MAEKMRVKNGQYEIVEELGAGGFGKVFKVKDTINSNMVLALKRIEAGASNTTESNNDEVMVKEAKLLKDLKSNYIIEYFDYFREGFFHYIVTEFANDGDLAQRIASYKKADKKFSDEIVLCWTTQLLKGYTKIYLIFRII